MSDTVSQVRNQIKGKPDYLLDKQRLRSLLNDLLPRKTENVNILTTLYFDLDVHQEIIDAVQIDDYFINRIAKNLEAQFGTKLDEARKGVEFWVNCLRGIELPRVVEGKDPNNTEITTRDVSIFKIETQASNISNINEDYLYFPCGVGHQDLGFFFTGIDLGNACEHKLASIYALLFSYLQRCTYLIDNRVFNVLQKEANQKFDFRRIYRLMILILVLVRGNYFNKSNHINVTLSGWKEKEFIFALDNINRYIKLFSALAKTDPQDLSADFGKRDSIGIGGVNSTKEIKIIDSKKRLANSRMMWFEENIDYNITTEDKKYFTFILQEAFKLKEFLPGQFEAIRDILNSDKHKICIMPTGSGKSIIYYFLSLLQPNPTMVLAPTKLLIRDQVHILKNKHEIDDIQILEEFSDHSDFDPKNKFIFLTPLTFISSNLINKVIQLNNNHQLSNFILDEVHCISNWSHDFRPEYLMISYNLRNFVDRTRSIGFTATANYTVVKDLVSQLNLNNDGKDIIVPIELKKEHHFSFLEYQSNEECMTGIDREINDFVNTDVLKNNHQLLVFTKDIMWSKLIRDNLREELKHQVEVFSSANRDSYQDFASNRYKVLLGDSEVGIGINLPGVTNTIHFGTPISKSQFIQEVGRAGRDGSKAMSKVIFRTRASLSPELENLLRRNTPTNEIISFVKHSDSNLDLISAFSKIIGDVETQKEYLENTLSIFSEIHQQQKDDETNVKRYIKLIIDKNKTYDECLNQYMRYLYVLYRVGYLYNWYIVNHNKSEGYVEFLLEVNDERKLWNIKQKTKEYLWSMGDYKAVINKINTSNSVEEVIENYISWHYNQFLYHHREQFMEMYDFLEIFKNSTDEHISSALKEYFSLSLFDIKNDSSKYKTLSIGDIFRLINQGVENKKIEDIRKSNENEYSPKLDLLLFLFEVKAHNQVNIDRFERIVENLSFIEFQEMISVIDWVYNDCNSYEKVLIVNLLCKRMKLVEVINTIYNKVDQDVVYYAILSACCNNYFVRKNGKSN
jgi:superfamily II DNA helicase RecQ